MTELDQALETFIEAGGDHPPYYDLVLNTQFFIPTVDEDAPAEKTAVNPGETCKPLLLESEGKSYLMLFDSEERLSAWAKQSVPFLALPGHAVARMTPPNLHWALNVGTGFSKEFLPGEIGWLREVAEQCEEETEREI